LPHSPGAIAGAEQERRSGGTGSAGGKQPQTGGSVTAGGCHRFLIRPGWRTGHRPLLGKNRPIPCLGHSSASPNAAHHSAQSRGHSGRSAAGSGRPWLVTLQPAPQPGSPGARQGKLPLAAPEFSRAPRASRVGDQDGKGMVSSGPKPPEAGHLDPSHNPPKPPAGRQAGILEAQIFTWPWTVAPLLPSTASSPLPDRAENPTHQGDP